MQCPARALNRRFCQSDQCKFDHFGPLKGQMGQKRTVSVKKRLFLAYSTIAEIRSKFDHFGPQKGRWARNGPFPLKNGLFLVYRTIAEIRSKLNHFGPGNGSSRNLLQYKQNAMKSKAEQKGSGKYGHKSIVLPVRGVFGCVRGLPRTSVPKLRRLPHP